jgi:hypothetical protein
MKRNRLIARLVICAGILLPAIAFTGSRLAADDDHDRCSVKSLKGSFAARLWGWQGTGAARVPTSAAGVVVLDGRGGITGSATFSVDGTILPAQPVNGSYTVDAETCTGDAVTTVGTFHFAVGNNMRETRFVGTTPGTTVIGDTIKQ